MRIPHSIYGCAPPAGRGRLGGPSLFRPRGLPRPRLCSGASAAAPIDRALARGAESRLGLRSRPSMPQAHSQSLPPLVLLLTTPGTRRSRSRSTSLLASRSRPRTSPVRLAPSTLAHSIHISGSAWWLIFPPFRARESLFKFIFSEKSPPAPLPSPTCRLPVLPGWTQSYSLRGFGSAPLVPQPAAGEVDILAFFSFFF